MYDDPKRPDGAVLEPGMGTWTVVPVLLGGVGMLVTGGVTLKAVAILLNRLGRRRRGRAVVP